MGTHRGGKVGVYPWYGAYLLWGHLRLLPHLERSSGVGVMGSRLEIRERGVVVVEVGGLVMCGWAREGVVVGGMCELMRGGASLRRTDGGAKLVERSM